MESKYQKSETRYQELEIKYRELQKKYQKLLSENLRLEQKEQDLTVVYSSNFWKIASGYYRLRNAPILRHIYKSLMTIKNEGFWIFFKKIYRRFREYAFKLIGDLRGLLPVDKTVLLSTENSNKYDVIFFSIINWDFRFQRPQHIATHFAKNNHRILYLSVNLRKQSSYSRRKIQENIYEITLPFKDNTTIYNTNIQEGLGELTIAINNIFDDFKIKESVAFVEFPLWYPLVNWLKNEYGTKIIFDCLDEFSEFQGVSIDTATAEDMLLRSSDYCITTSIRLHEKHRDKLKDIALIRNATEFEHFHHLPPNNILKNIPKPIIGYYGAVAEWFDTDTIEYIASKRPDWSIVLIGHSSSSVKASLDEYENIYFLGEKSYFELPKFLYWFDVCLIPFKLNELILSTNPVKFYEYISSGKPVVSSPLPELSPYSALLYISSGKEEFLENIEKALKEKDEDLKIKRIEVARMNDWESRFCEIRKCINSTCPLVSIIIITFNNLEHTRKCIESIYAKTAYPNFELIIVDNASTDGTIDYLSVLKETHANVKIIVNKENYGFASANNIGIRESRGKHVILLNNDTVVTRGWISGLIKYLDDPTVGMVGPVTNSIGNEARIIVDYTDLSKMDSFAERYTSKNKGKAFEIAVLAMYCVALSRRTVDKVGLLDEQYSVGMFEDDDYALRVKNAGLKVICTEDVFIHHFGGASFGKLHSDEYQSVFNDNKNKYEVKWGIKWQPHRYRD